MPHRRNDDPYAPPPMHHDRSGPVLRVAVIAALLGAAAWGYMTFAPRQGEQTALAPEAAPEQQLADAGYTSAPETLPPAVAQPAPPAPAAVTARPRRAAPAAPPPEPAEPAPSASTPPASMPPTTPTPIPPVDLPPSG
ncbi:MAG: hypothetical protein AB7T59_10395 [Hyphomonadaceae bacterium]